MKGGELLRRHALELSTDPISPYIISNTSDWSTLADKVTQDGQSYAGVHFRMTADIDANGVSVGSDEKPFSGIFDGDGHVLTYNKGTWTDQAITGVNEYCAPFIYLKGATIRHLTTTGTVCTEQLYNGGIAVIINDAPSSETASEVATTLYNCRSDINFWLMANFEVYTGGLVGFVVGNTTTVPTFEKCVFNGQFNYAGRDYSGLVGMSKVSHVKFKNCMFGKAHFL